MRKIAVVGLAALLLTGCLSRPGPQKVAEMKEQIAMLDAERDAGKISWTEWARRQVGIVKAGMRLSPAEEQLAAYKVLLASRVDAKKLTPEEFDYEWASAKAKFASAEAAQNAQQRAALANVGDSLTAMSIANRPVTTNCNKFGNSVSCTTY